MIRAKTIIVPAVLVALTAAVQWLLIQAFGAATTYLIFVLPVIASAILVGFTGGLVANALGLIAAYVIPSTAIWRGVDEGATVPIRLVLMAIIGLVISTIVDRLRSKERELRRRTDELEQITDAMPVYVVRCAADQTFLFVNRSYAQRFDLTASEVIGRKIAHVLGPAAYNTLRPYMDRALGGEQVTFETEVGYEGLGARTMHCEYVPERAADGSVRSFVGVIVDVTDERRAAAAAEANRVRAQLAAEAAELGTWEWNAETGTLNCSPRASDLLGLDPAVVLTLELLQSLIHPSDRERITESLATSIAAPQPGALLTAECRILRVSDGEQRWIRVTGQVDALDGRLVHAVGTVQDVSEHHSARAALEQALSREHQARTHAEHASRLKDEFLATLSHELRTPLNAILGYTRMLRTGAMPRERREQALEIIERNARLQRELVDDILDVSRIITGKLRLTPSLIDPTSVIEMAIESMRPAAEAKRLRLSLGVHTTAARVLVDPDRLQQVVWNLLSNAVKFTPEGGSVRVEMRADTAHGQLTISVADSGKGISPAFLPHVFERFRQGDSTSSREHGGLGLGLAIVRHLVELQGGTIDAASEGEGRGATFTVCFPMRPMEATPDETHGTHVFREGALPRDARLDGIRVLVVDDEADALALVSSTLESCGASVTAAMNGPNGLRELDREVPDIIVSDIGMPGMDGHEFMRAVRERPSAEGGRVPAIALTAYGADVDRDAALNAGYQVHIVKPCEPRDLTSAIAGLVGMPR